MKRLTELNPEWVGVLRPNSGEGLAEQLTKVVAEKFPEVQPESLSEQLAADIAVCYFIQGHHDSLQLPVNKNTKPALEEFWRMVSARMPAC